MLFTCKPTNPVPVLQATIHLPLQTQVQVTGDNSYTPEPADVIQTRQSWAYRSLAHLLFPKETTIKTLGSKFPLFLSTSWLTLAFLHIAVHSLAMPPAFGTYENNNLFLHWQLSPDLLASAYLNNNKTYILKQFAATLFPGPLVCSRCLGVYLMSPSCDLWPTIALEAYSGKSPKIAPNDHAPEIHTFV